MLPPLSQGNNAVYEPFVPPIDEQPIPQGDDDSEDEDEQLDDRAEALHGLRRRQRAEITKVKAQIYRLGRPCVVDLEEDGVKRVYQVSDKYEAHEEMERHLRRIARLDDDGFADDHDLAMLLCPHLDNNNDSLYG